LFWRLFPTRVAILLWCGLLLPARAQTNAVLSPSPPIRNVTFEGTTALSTEDQQKLIQFLQQEEPTWVARQPLDALSSFIQNAVLTTYQDRGYWRAKVSAKITWVKGNGESRQVDVLISSLDQGAQYRLQEIRFTGATAFSGGELLALMPIHPSDLMSRTQVEHGLEAMRRLYAARGYFAFTATPRPEFDDTAHTAVLNVIVQEDSPFRFGNLVIEGFDRATSRGLQQIWEQVQNQPYSEEKLRGVLAKALPLPSGADPLDYSARSLDFDTHTVDVVVSFAPAQAERLK
jgi:outer membrane protein assembly factor BamA